MSPRANVLLFSLALLTSAPAARSDTPELPTYFYAIRSSAYEEAGPFLAAVHVPVPSTVWLCDITYSGHAGMMLRCATPRLSGGELPEVIARVNCATADADAETLHLSTLDQGVYASISIMCKRSLVDDGF